jgi:hypothetical protein
MKIRSLDVKHKPLQPTDKGLSPSFGIGCGPITLHNEKCNTSNEKRVTSQWKPWHFTMKTVTLHNENRDTSQWKPWHFTMKTVILHNENRDTSQWKPWYFTMPLLFYVPHWPWRLFIVDLNCIAEKLEFISSTYHLIYDLIGLRIVHHISPKLIELNRLNAFTLIIFIYLSIAIPSIQWPYGPYRALASSLRFHNSSFYDVGLLAPRPTPNLEDQVSVFMTSGDRVAQLYPRALGSSGTSGGCHSPYPLLWAPEGSISLQHHSYYIIFKYWINMPIVYALNRLNFNYLFSKNCLKFAKINHILKM